MPDLQIRTLEELCSALDQAASAAEVRLISAAWDHRESKVHQSWGDELIFDAHRAFDVKNATARVARISAGLNQRLADE